MAESVQAFTYRDVVLTLAGGGGNVTYSTSTGAAHGSATEYLLVGEPGDISITFGGSGTSRVLDRGVFDQLRLGDDEPSEVSGSAQFRDMLDGSADTLVAWLTSLRDGSANNKDSNVPESTSVSTSGADDAEVMSAALKIVWTNAGNSADTAAIAWNVVSCSSFSIAESAGDVTKVSFSFVCHDAPANVYQA
tara:strand:- start:2458 stop:3033 length:576 start_codon:yes stop_codon:yes gene_type:complete